MTKDDITRMAQEAGFVGMDGDHGALRRFAALVASAERSACAKVCEKRIAYYWQRDDNRRDEGEACAAAIRARKENT